MLNGIASPSMGYTYRSIHMRQCRNKQLIRQDACSVFEPEQGVVCEYGMDTEKMGM